MSYIKLEMCESHHQLENSKEKGSKVHLFVFV